jgi:hypothetical protein
VYLVKGKIILTFMSEDDKKAIGQRVHTRVENGLLFVETEYLDRHQVPDLAWIRNIYILMSFYTELLLKGIFVMRHDHSDITALNQKLKTMGHDLEEIGKGIGTIVLKEFGIKNITKDKSTYLIETTEGDYEVIDFIDIRYDFLTGKIRTICGDEHEKFRIQIKSMRESLEKLKKLVF